MSNLDQKTVIEVAALAGAIQSLETLSMYVEVMQSSQIGTDSLSFKMLADQIKKMQVQASTKLTKYSEEHNETI